MHGFMSQLNPITLKALQQNTCYFLNSPNMRGAIGVYVDKAEEHAHDGKLDEGNRGSWERVAKQLQASLDLLLKIEKPETDLTQLTFQDFHNASQLAVELERFKASAGRIRKEFQPVLNSIEAIKNEMVLPSLRESLRQFWDKHRQALKQALNLDMDADEKRKMRFYLINPLEGLTLDANAFLKPVVKKYPIFEMTEIIEKMGKFTNPWTPGALSAAIGDFTSQIDPQIELLRLCRDFSPAQGRTP